MCNARAEIENEINAVNNGKLFHLPKRHETDDNLNKKKRNYVGGWNYLHFKKYVNKYGVEEAEDVMQFFIQKREKRENFHNFWY